MNDTTSSQQTISKTARANALAQQLHTKAAWQEAHDWKRIGRPNQQPPEGDWRFWLIMAGRGWGKTRTGSAWVQQVAYRHADARIAIIGHTLHDVRSVMVEGDSGLLRTALPWNVPVFHPSRRLITWPNGAVGHVFSAEEPEQLRGPQMTHAWCDEMAKWRDDRTWDNLMFALRLGRHPRCVITTTPRPDSPLDQVLKQDGVIITRGSTYDNADNLSASYLSYLKNEYDNTTLGQQEIHGELITATEGALWTPDMIARSRIQERDLTPEMRRDMRVVIAVDPATSHGKYSDETGIVMAGYYEGHGYVLQDLSGKYSPHRWSELVREAFTKVRADRIVVEVNQGGNLVTELLWREDDTLPISAVHATQNKRTRAEPIAALYEQDRIHHVGCHGALENQMCRYTGDKRRGKSPDRLDAMVWALSALFDRNNLKKPGIRQV